MKEGLGRCFTQEVTPRRDIINPDYLWPRIRGLRLRTSLVVLSGQHDIKSTAITTHQSHCCITYHIHHILRPYTVPLPYVFYSLLSIGQNPVLTKPALITAVTYAERETTDRDSRKVWVYSYARQKRIPICHLP